MIPPDPGPPAHHERSRPEGRLPDYAFVGVLFVTGLLVNLFFARMGFMPLDASIVFDGGWRLLSGQVPWRDFTTPNGVVPSAMQALVFALVGRTWFAYCLHSSIINGAFAAVLYLLLVVLRLPRPLAFFYGLCASFFFYPPVGVPFMEQHSFFFTLAALTAAVAGNCARHERTQGWLWAAVPPLALLAFFSKQVPFAFAAPALPILLILPGPARIRTRVTALAWSIAASAAVLLALSLVLRIPWTTVLEYSVARPRDVGGLRAVALPELAEKVARRYDNLPNAMGLHFIGNAVFLYRLSLLALPILIGAWIAGRRRDAAIGDDLTRLGYALILAPLTYVTSMLLGFVANNQTQNSVAFYAVGAGLLHAAVWSELRIARRGMAVSVAGRGSRNGDRWTAWLRPATWAALVAVSIAPVRHWTRDTITWVTTVNMTRMVNDMTFDRSLAAASATSLPAGMAFLRWTPSPASYDLAGWTDLTAFLRARDRNFLIIGDTLVTYGLVGKPSVAPNLWFHPGLAMPDPSEPAFAAYERKLIARIMRHDVRCIVLEGRQTRLGFGIHHLPVLNAWLASGWTHTHTFGANRVFERGSRPYQAIP